MKKIIAIVLTVAAMLSLAAVSASAATKADLITEASKSPVYKYVGVAFENALRTVEITDEQADQLIPIIRKACTILGDNEKGHGGFFSAEHGQVYSREEYNAVMTCVDEACRILGYTYTTVPSTNSKHAGDSVFMVYNEQGKNVFHYDGDVVADTSAATTADTTLILAGAAAFLVLGLGAVVISKRRVDAE